MRTIICKNCGKEFITKANKRIYCIDCSKLLRAKTYRDYYCRNQEKVRERLRIYYLNNRDKFKIWRKNAYEKQKEKFGQNISKLISEQERFGGNRIKALKRDNYICQLCGSKDKILVHHEDETGRSSKTHNNNLDNLITLCRNCHTKIHKPDSYRKVS